MEFIKDLLSFLRERKKLWLLPLIFVLLIFGVGRISKIGGELGKGINAFREGVKEGQEENKEESEEADTKA